MKAGIRFASVPFDYAFKVAARTYIQNVFRAQMVIVYVSPAHVQQKACSVLLSEPMWRRIDLGLTEAFFLGILLSSSLVLPVFQSYAMCFMFC